MTNNQLTPTQIRLRLFVAVIALAAGVSAVVIAVVEVKGILG
jgi:hypothetical protein